MRRNHSLRLSLGFGVGWVRVVLDADMVVIFPTSEAVNEALCVLATVAQNLPNANSTRQRKPIVAHAD